MFLRAQPWAVAQCLRADMSRRTGAHWGLSLRCGPCLRPPPAQILVGVWGNSNYSQPDQWVALAPSNAPPGPLQWSAATGTCSNLITGLDITLLSGISGDGANPQPKLLYGRACFRYGTWKWDAANPVGSAQRFPLSFKVYFKAAAQAPPTSTTKPSPPLAMPLPPDLFYPFLT